MLPGVAVSAGSVRSTGESAASSIAATVLIERGRSTGAAARQR
jgi:hypothetical protein